MKIEYTLEIYEPDDDSCVFVVYKSETPFGALCVGDTIRTDRTIVPLKITKIEHLFWEIENSHIGNKICVSTTKED